MGEKSLDELIADLESDGIEVRKFSYSQFATSEDERIPQVLIAVLRDPNIRSNALTAIFARHARDNNYVARAIPESPQYVQPLIDLLKQDEIDHLVTEQVLVTLGFTEDMRAVEAITPFLDHTDHYIREAAASALGYTKNIRSVPYLLKVLRDRDPRIRWVTTQSLGVFDTPEAIQGLISVLHDAGRLYPRTIESVVADPVGLIAQQWLLKKGDLVRQPLVETFDDETEDPLVRARAGVLLIELGDNRAAEYVLSTLDEMLVHDGMLWRQSAEALAQIGQLSAIEILSVHAQSKHPWTAAVAKSAITRIRIAHETSIPELLAYLKDNRNIYDIQSAARKRLKELGYKGK